MGGEWSPESGNSYNKIKFSSAALKLMNQGHLYPDLASIQMSKHSAADLHAPRAHGQIIDSDVAHTCNIYWIFLKTNQANFHTYFHIYIALGRLQFAMKHRVI